MLAATSTKANHNSIIGVLTMTNDDIIQHLNIIHDSVDNLKDLSYSDGLKASQLTPYLELLALTAGSLHDPLVKFLSEGSHND